MTKGRNRIADLRYNSHGKIWAARLKELKLLYFICEERNYFGLMQLMKKISPGFSYRNHG
jgi:hypothetical protein